MLARLILACLAWMVGDAHAAPPGTAEDTVRATTAAVVARLRDERAAITADPARLEQLAAAMILPRVDFTTLAELVLATRWAELSDGERGCFADGLRARLLTRYAGLLRLYDDQAVSYATAADGAGRSTVTQTIALADSMPLVLGYRMHVVDDAWQVVDLTVDGESLVAGYRDQFRYDIGRLGLGDFLRTFPACRER